MAVESPTTRRSSMGDFYRWRDMECIESVSAMRADVWRWMDENWRDYVCHAADLKRYPMADKVPHGSGVYFIWDDSGALLYVGQSTGLRPRICQHRRMPGAAYWSYIPLNSWGAAEQVEGCYIRALGPLLNKGTTIRMWPGHQDMVAAIVEATRSAETFSA